MHIFAFVVLVKLAALFIGAANAYIVAWLTLSWLQRENCRISNYSAGQFYPLGK